MQLHLPLAEGLDPSCAREGAAGFFELVRLPPGDLEVFHEGRGAESGAPYRNGDWWEPLCD
jgi:hypothetical protein